MKKSMTYSCQNRRLLKAGRKNEKRRKGIERVHFSSSLLSLALWHVGVFCWWFGCCLFGFCLVVCFFGFFSFGDKVICAVLYLGCSSRSVHDKLQKHGCFLSQNQSLYFKFVHDCFGVDCRVLNT